MGETWQDRIDMAFELAALKVQSIPINVLTAIKGTAFEKLLVSDITVTGIIFLPMSGTAA